MRDHTVPKLTATGNSILVLQAQGDGVELPVAAIISGFDNDKDADEFGQEWVKEQVARTGQADEGGKPLFSYTVYEEVTLTVTKKSAAKKS